MVAVPALLGPAIAYGVSRILSSRYTSQSLMLIERQKVPDSYVKPLITEDLNARIASLQEQVLSRTHLQPIIERLGLFKDDVAHQGMDGAVAHLQKAIELTPLKPIVTTRNQEVPGFYIDVTLDDPQKAQQVCAEIASMFVEESIKQREGSAQGTANFLQSQLDDAKRKLDEQDGKLAAFKREHMGMLPDEVQTEANLITTLNTQLEAVTQALNRAQQDKTYAESVLAQQIQAWRVMKAARVDAGLGQDPDLLQKQLGDLQNRLAELRSRYTEDYPDVVSTRAQIADLKKRIGDTGAQLEQTASRKRPVNGETAGTVEPPEIQQLRAQVHAYQENIETNRREQQRLRDAIQQYQSRLQMIPGVEQDYKELTRDHETALQFYKDLLAKRDQSAMATDMEFHEQGERFQVLDPANLPDAPSFPNRPLFALGGLGFGLALGLALAVIVETTKKCIRTERDLEFYLGTGAVALIPLMTGGGNGKHNGRGQLKEADAAMRVPS